MQMRIGTKLGPDRIQVSSKHANLGFFAELVLQMIKSYSFSLNMCFSTLLSLFS